MIRLIDSFLNQFTMYQIALYESALLLCVAFGLACLGLLPFSPFALLFSVSLILLVASVVNGIFASAFNAPSNYDSVLITALILALIISPPTALFDAYYLSLAIWGTTLAIASKYILAINRKHLFNPAAVGVLIAALVLNQSATWWIGTSAMLPFVFIGGILVVRKIRRFDLVVSFMVAALTTTLLFGSGDSLVMLSRIFMSTGIVFFATVMLTEPFTTPPTRRLRILYGLLTGLLFLPQLHIGSLYFTPELALVLGNIFAYLVSAKEKLVLTLVNRIQLSPTAYEFVFASSEKTHLTPGQYMEWTVAHEHTDMRGIRRYFTIASSPEDPDIRIGIKFAERGSSFKEKLLTLTRGDTVVAASRGGDFILPKDTRKKIAFIAGGIGVTPYISMLRDLEARRQRRPIVMLYANRRADDVPYQSVIEEVRSLLGIPTRYFFSEMAPVGEKTGAITNETIRTEIPDFLERTFYVSGPEAMVTAVSSTLRSLGIPPRCIKKDYFPGFA